MSVAPLTRAADSLGMQKANLSRVITKLERKLGARLLERTTRSLSLTEIGREVFERAVGILGAGEDTARVAHRMLAEPRGTLRLTCGVEFGMIAGGGWVAEYLERYPLVSWSATSRAGWWTSCTRASILPFASAIWRIRTLPPASWATSATACSPRALISRVAGSRRHRRR